MDVSTLSQLSPIDQSQSRSFGVKLMVVCGLALLMAIPALFVSGLVHERSDRALKVTQEVSKQVGGPQTFLGPTVAIPYSIPSDSAAVPVKQGVYLVFPSRGVAALKTTTEERRRSLFTVPVFQADARFNASFDLTGVPALAPPGALLDWTRAEIVVGVSDAHGALADATLTGGDKTVTLAPAQSIETMNFGSNDKQRARLTVFGAPLTAVATPNAPFQVASRLQFSGAQRIAVLAYGKTTELTAQGDWHHPGFDGGLLPVSRNISSRGFDAKWLVPFVARGVRAEGPDYAITGLETTALGVSFIEVTDSYQSVNRSLKYVLLFLGLIFLSYFMFEVTTGKRVHPAQYLLVGMAQIVFYVLLLSLSERIGFDFGFLLAGGATVALLSINAQWVFSSQRQGLRALFIFGLLYFFIYILLQLEDTALLVGALASFAAVSAAMYFTRGIDWYSSGGAAGDSEPQTLPLPPGKGARNGS